MPGGRKASTIVHMNDRFGMHTTERTPSAQWDNQIVPGIVEAHWLLADRGLLWFKCMDYVWDGRVHWFSKLAYPVLTDVGFEPVDEFVLARMPGPQPTLNRVGTPRRQVHARHAHSVLMIAHRRRGT